MSSIVNHSAKLIGIVDYDQDSILELLLEQWQLQTIRIQPSDTLTTEIEDDSVLPSLIILNLAPRQSDVTKIVRHFRQDSVVGNIPLLCCLYPREQNTLQESAGKGIHILNKPFELEKLYFNLEQLLGETLDSQQSESAENMTIIVSKPESSSLIKEQEHWLKVFQEHSEQDAGKLLTRAGYEVKAPSFID